MEQMLAEVQPSVSHKVWRTTKRARSRERQGGDDDPRDSLMRDVDLPRGDERGLVVDRDRVYELNGEGSRTLAAVGTFHVVPEQELDTDHDIRTRRNGQARAWCRNRNVHRSSRVRSRNSQRDDSRSKK